MLVFLRNFTVFLFLASAFSCATIDPFQQLSDIEPNLKSQGRYNAYLGLEYLEFSRSLIASKQNADARYFSRKALSIINGDKFIPESPLKWKADRDQIEEFLIMQKRMESVLSTPHIKFYLPIQMAHLSYLYDCWVARESKPVFRFGELAHCKPRFYKLIDEIQQYIDFSSKEKITTEIVEPDFERFEILFDLNDYQFNDKANTKLILLLKYLLTLNGDYRILVVGSADRTGNELYNQNIALKRADVVQHYLTSNGVPSDAIELRSYGEDFPDIITRKQMQQQSNRSVAIYVLKGIAPFSLFRMEEIESKIYRKEVEKARATRGIK